ncbi:hypothetical protein Cgig2_002213 [Carnegiea gigantea]|uniref:DUF4283 domain-containing protein n=1 Tax=Carnegiea gigantea TaxID=171969 RepID=A0A9Q1GUR4_9CARY|nr:hypothetical protein Cgig2_002213 [Carnegiea gigantea]
MARGGRRGRPRLVAQGSLAASKDVPITEPQSLVPPESIQVEILAAQSNEALENLVIFSSSYASLVDPDEGTDLKFVSAELLNGKKVVKIDRDDGFVKRIWAAYEIDEIIQVRRGVFMIRLVNIQDKIGSGSLSKLGRSHRIPLKTDKYTKEKTMLKYARLLIDISLEGPFPNFIEFFDEEGVLIRQPVICEWKPIKCTHCHMFGHEVINCKRKREERTEWRPVSRVCQGDASTMQVEITTDQQTTNKEEVFTPVPKRGAAKQPRQSAGQATPQETAISHQMNEGWCIIGDFNAILYKDDRNGGNEIQRNETKELEDFIEQGDLQELRWNGPYYSWTNKTI